jgi:hypothetical protein
MSFSALVPPPINGIRSIFSAGSLGAAAKYAGAAAVGGVVAATYQIAYEEGRTMVQGLRAKSLARREHNDMISLRRYLHSGRQATAPSMAGAVDDDDIRIMWSVGAAQRGRGHRSAEDPTRVSTRSSGPARHWLRM